MMRTSRRGPFAPGASRWSRMVRTLAVLAVILLGGVAAANDRAPALQDVQWIAEGPVPARGADQLVVVEVFATWCAACHASFPLLTQLQAAYGDRIRVVAVSGESPAAVRHLLHSRHDSMAFAVGVADEATVRAFLFGGFGGLGGYPSAFVLREGRVVWGGHPMDLEDALVAQIGSASPVP